MAMGLDCLRSSRGQCSLQGKGTAWLKGRVDQRGSYSCPGAAGGGLETGEFLSKGCNLGPQA